MAQELMHAEQVESTSNLVNGDSFERPIWATNRKGLSTMSSPVTRESHFFRALPENELLGIAT